MALLGSIFTLVQIFLLASDREGICLNDGCEIVDSLTVVPPLYINITGFFFFQLIFWGIWIAKKDQKYLEYVNLILLAGIAAEGVLVAFQQIIAQTFCSYCLIILGFIVVLNILAGVSQTLRGATVFAAVLIGFFSLQFENNSENPMSGLDNGTFARVEGNENEKRYLFFSSTCKYCEQVIESLNGDNECAIRFNPIDTITEFAHNSAKRMETYDPEVNKKLLKSFGLKQIPVLITSNASSFRVITGSGQIEQYLFDNCRNNLELQITPNQQSFSSPPGFDFLSPNDEACAVDTDCEDPLLPQQPQ